MPRFLFTWIFTVVSFSFCTAQSTSEWQKLDEEGTRLFQEQDYPGALDVFKRAEVEAKKEFGEAHVNYAYTVQSLAVLSLYTGDFTTSEFLFKKALSIHEKAAGKNNAEYCSYLDGIISLYMTMGNDQEALVYFKQSHPITKEVYGTESNEYYSSLIGLADMYMDLGQYANAIPLLQEGRALTKTLEGPTYGDFCAYLFQVFAEQGDPAKAEPFYLEAKSIRNKSQEEYWKTLDFSSISYSYEIDDQDARLKYWTEMAEQFKAEDPRSVSYASAVMNLAILYQAQEDYKKAEPLLLEAMSIIREAGTLIDYSAACNGMANYFDAVGNATEAEKFYKEEISVKRRVLGRSDISYGTACNNQSAFYINRGETIKGELLAKTALLVFAGRQDGFTYYTAACQGLSILYEKQGDLEKAESYQREAERILAMAFGKEHYTYAPVLLALGKLREKKNDQGSAEQMILQAKSINEKIFGKDHAQYAGYCYEVGRYYQRQSNYQRAQPYFREAAAIKLKRVLDNFGNMSEREKRDYYASGKYFVENYAYNMLKTYPQNPAIASDLFSLQMQAKGLIHQSNLKMRYRILSSGNAALISKYEAWAAKRDNLVNAYGMSIEERKKKGVDILAMEKEVNDLEKALTKEASMMTGYSLEENKNYQWTDVQARLKPGEVAIEVVRATKDGQNKDAIYGALIITPDSKSQPELIILNNGAELESKYSRYYSNVIRTKIKDTISYNMFWRPIVSKLKEVKRIYFSPDGVYHQLSIPTLFNATTGKFVADEQAVVIVGNTRDLIKPARKSNQTGSNLIIGFPDYKLGSGPANPSEPRPTANEELANSSQRFFDRNTGSVVPLPGTHVEVNLIDQLLKQRNLPSKLLTGESATETQLKAIKNPAILHIATHGFFLPNQDLFEVANQSSKKLQDPLLRSGLLLAGCEKRFAGTTNISNEDDGILTAYEATNLFLDETDLVVLSACETGVGEIDNGEGVYGLQRAFQQAGARYVLSSLWKVDDEATQLLMTTFYSERLKGLEYQDAFISARSQVREKFPAPYYWGAFVLIGK